VTDEPLAPSGATAVNGTSAAPAAAVEDLRTSPLRELQQAPPQARSTAAVTPGASPVAAKNAPAAASPARTSAATSPERSALTVSDPDYYTVPSIDALRRLSQAEVRLGPPPPAAAAAGARARARARPGPVLT